jgi:hypothetical protein
MRREGYELSISKPNVIMKRDAEGQPAGTDRISRRRRARKNLGGVMGLVGNRRGELVRRTIAQRPGASGIHDPRPRPDRPADPHDDRHAGPGDHASQLPRIRPARGEIPGRTNGVMICQHRHRQGQRLLDEHAPGPRRDVRRARGSCTKARSSPSTAGRTMWWSIRPRPSR